MAKRKIAKVINQHSEYLSVKPFQRFYGECSCCGATVSHSSYGWDEECEECGCELDWLEGGRNEADIQ